MSDHSIIPPSSAGRRVQCAGSAIMEMMYPETEESDEAREGTASHELAATMVDSASRARTDWPTRAVGQAASNGVAWSQESYDAAEMCTDDIYDVMTTRSLFNPQIEKRVDIGVIHPESWGTPDCWLFDVKTWTLLVWDYKYGHRPVEVFENWQMIEYVAGLLAVIEAEHDLGDNYINVIMTIVQPRAPHRDGPIRRWTIRASDLRPYFDTLIATEAAALSADPDTCVGAECRDCKARRACDTLISAGGSIMDLVGKPIPVNLDADALGTELVLLRKASELLKALLSGFTAQAEGLIQNGETVPGFALEQGYGRQKWSEDSDSIIQMCDLLGVDVRKPAEPKTPKQVLKLGVDESVIKEYSYTPRTDAKLVPSTQTIASAVFQRGKT